MQQSDLASIKSLLLHALQQPEDRRISFIDSHPDYTDQQKRETLELLQAQTKAPALLSSQLTSLLPPRSFAIGDDILRLGEVIAERYLIQSLLSRTRSSQVYLARDLRLAGNQVALKLIPIHAARFKEMQDQLWSEIESLARLHHPSISGLIDTGIHHDHPFLVTQFYPGLTLDAWVESNKANHKLRVRVFLQLVSAVEVIHSAGLVHLDLKPQNVIVSADNLSEPAITILDFGISAVSSESILHRAGTPNYSAPERSKGLASPASDVYSLACIGAEVLPLMPASVQRILTQAKSPNPGLRPATAAALRSQLESALTSHQRRRMAAVVVLIAAVLVMTLFIFSRKQPIPLTSPNPHLREITRIRGVESAAAFSVDGRTVYFRQDLDNGTSAIASVPYAGGEAQQLFLASPMTQIMTLAVSPDSKHIAYLQRLDDQSAEILYGNLEDHTSRKLYFGNVQTLNFGPSPNLIYFSETVNGRRGSKLRFLDIAKGSIEDLLPASTEDFMDLDISISPDGKYAAFVRFRMRQCSDLYLIPLLASGRVSGSPVRITNLDQRIRNPHWFSDSKTILFTAGSLTNTHVYKAVLNEQAGRPASVTQISGLGSGLKFPATSYSDRVVLTRENEDEEIYRLKLSRPAGLQRFISSTALDEEPKYSPDGKFVAFFSERSGSLQGWIADVSSPSTPRSATNFELAERPWTGWNAAGEAIFFAHLLKLGPLMVAVSPNGQTSPRQILSAFQSQQIAGISADGMSVFAELNSRGEPSLERWSLQTGAKERIFSSHARYAREFYRYGQSGERIILFAERLENNGLFVLENGSKRQVYPSLSRRNTFTYHNGYVYLASNHPQPGIYKINLSTGKSALLAHLDRLVGWGMDVSPDGEDLLISLFDVSDANIVAVE